MSCNPARWPSTYMFVYIIKSSFIEYYNIFLFCIIFYTSYRYPQYVSSAYVTYNGVYISFHRARRDGYSKHEIVRISFVMKLVWRVIKELEDTCGDGGQRRRSLLFFSPYIYIYIINSIHLILYTFYIIFYYRIYKVRDVDVPPKKPVSFFVVNRVVRRRQTNVYTRARATHAPYVRSRID